MALAENKLSSTNEFAAGTGVHVTGSVSNTANALLLLAIHNQNEDNNAPYTILSVTGLGLTWVQVDTQTYYDFGGHKLRRLSVWRAMGAASSGAITITANVGGGDPRTNFIVYLSEYTGVDTTGTNGSGAVKQVVKAESSSGATTHSVSLAALADSGNWAYGFCGFNWSNSGFTLGSSFTLIYDDPWTHDGAHYVANERRANVTTVDFSVGAADTTLGLIAIEIGVPSAATREQEGYRWRADDGDEDGATWLAAQDTNISRAKLTNTRLRILTNVTNDPPSEGLKLQYRRANGADEWKDVD